MAGLEVVLSLIDEFSGGIDNASSSVEGLEETVTSASSAIDSIEWSTLEDVSDAATDAGTNLGSASDEATNLGTSLASIDPSPVKDTADAANDAANGLSSANAEASTFDQLAGAAAAVGLGATIWAAADAAGGYADSWSRLGTVFSDTAMTMEQAQATYGASVRSIGESTGRTGGQIREALSAMSLAGMRDMGLMQDALNSLSGAAFLTGNSFDSVVAAFNQTVRTGNVSRNTLKMLGIDLTAVGMSVDEIRDKLKGMDPEARAAFLNMLMAESGAKAGLDAYKMSWEYLIVQLQKAWEYLNIIAGQLILPILIPAIIMATGVLEWLSSVIGGLDPNIKLILGAIIILVGAFLLVGAAVAILMPIISGLGVMLAFLAANPIVLVIMAIVLLIMALYWLYQTNEDFRNGVNAVWNALQTFGQWLMAFAWMMIAPVVGAIQMVIGALTWLGHNWQQLPFIISRAITQALVFIIMFPLRLWGYLLQAVNFLWNFAGQALGAAQGAGNNVFNGLISIITGLPGAVWNEMMAIGQAILSAGGALYNYAVSVGQQIYNGILAGLGISSPGFSYYAVVGELENIGGAFDEYTPKLAAQAELTGSGIYEGFEGGGIGNANINRDTSNHTLDINFNNVPSDMSEEKLAALTIEGISKSGAMQSKLNELLYNGDAKLKRAWGRR